MKIFLGAGFIAVLFVFPARAHARVFSLDQETFASYLTFSYGPSKVLDNAFYSEEASVASFSEDQKTNLGGEFGFVYATKRINWRFGFEILKPAIVRSTAANASGAAVYDVKSEITGYLPKIGVEINLKTTPAYRVMLFGYFGTTSVTVQNDYTNVTVAPMTDFTTKYKGNCSTKGGGLAFEYAAFDTSTFTLEFGYRDSVVDKLVYSADVNGFSGTTHSAGDRANWLAEDGKARELDFSGAYVSAGFRFYLF